MRLVRWTTEAAGQFENAVKHIQRDKPTAAREAAEAIMNRVEHLTNFPGIGRPGEMNGTRELVSPPFVVIYRYTEEIVEVLYVWHGAQDWR